MLFTTWTALLEQLRNDLASGQFRKVASYSIDGYQISYRSIEEFWKNYREVEERAAAESGLAYAQVITVPARGF